MKEEEEEVKRVEAILVVRVNTQNRARRLNTCPHVHKACETYEAM
jgi:hypothetical protein